MRLQRHCSCPHIAVDGQHIVEFAGLAASLAPGFGFAADFAAGFASGIIGKL